MPLDIIIAVIVVSVVGVAVIALRRMRRGAHDLMRRGNYLAAKRGRSPAEELELAEVSRRLTQQGGPLLDYRVEPLVRLRWLPDDIYRLVTSGINGTEDPQELEEFAQTVAFVHLGGGSHSETVWSGQALEFGRQHYDRYFEAEVASGSDEATADRAARARCGDLLSHYFPFCMVGRVMT